jgi:hypothetical protein
MLDLAHYVARPLTTAVSIIGWILTFAELEVKWPEDAVHLNEPRGLAILG